MDFAANKSHSARSGQKILLWKNESGDQQIIVLNAENPMILFH